MPEQDKYIFKNNEHFELVLKGLNAGVYEYYFDDGDAWWSSKFYDLLGYKRGDIPSNGETLLGHLVHPDDREQLEAKLQASQSSSNAFILEIRLQHRSGNYRWYKLSGQSKWENNTAVYIVGALTDIDQRVKEQQENQKYGYFLEEVGQMAKVGGWEVRFDPFQATMSREMALIHDFDPEHVPDFEQVIGMLKSEYQGQVNEAIDAAKTKGIPYDIEAMITTAKGREVWIRVIGKPVYNEQQQIVGLRGVVQDINEQKKALLEIQKNELLLEATGQIAKIGGWEVDYRNMQGKWSNQVALIHEKPAGFQPSLEEALQFVHPDYTPKIQEVMTSLQQEGEPFDVELKMITANKREIWVRAIGIPVFDPKTKKVIIARGVFQDIDDQKHKEQALQASMHLINDQNKRLLNFAHIVSHNLRSHAANFALTLSLMDLETDPEELQHFTQNLQKISQSFKETLENLNDVIAFQTDDGKLKVPVKFQTVLNNVLDTLKTQIEQSNASIKTDFSKCQEITYVPAYLESIFLNLLSNALKYRRPDLDPVIEIQTSLSEKGPVLTISDNGQGIDLAKHGNKIFGMYKTFHQHPEAKGIGLFITRNQIESMGGKISVESRVNEGTTFTVNF